MCILILTLFCKCLKKSDRSAGLNLSSMSSSTSNADPSQSVARMSIKNNSKYIKINRDSDDK